MGNHVSSTPEEDAEPSLKGKSLLPSSQADIQHLIHSAQCPAEIEELRQMASKRVHPNSSNISDDIIKTDTLHENWEYMRRWETNLRERYSRRQAGTLTREIAQEEHAELIRQLKEQRRQRKKSTIVSGSNQT